MVEGWLYILITGGTLSLLLIYAYLFSRPLKRRVVSGLLLLRYAPAGKRRLRLLRISGLFLSLAALWALLGASRLYSDKRVQWYNLVIDNSMSMLADSGGVTRLTLAKDAAISLSQSLSPRTPVRVYALNSGIVPLYIGPAKDAPKVIRGIKPTYRTADPALLKGLIKGISILFYDCTYKVPAGMYTVCKGVKRAANAGIEALEARTVLADPSKVDVLIRLRNFGPEPWNGVVRLESAGGLLYWSKKVTIPGRSRRDFIRTITPPPAKGTLKCYIRGSKDLLKEDDSACVRVHTINIRIGYYGRRNYYLLTALGLFDHAKIIMLDELSDASVRNLDLVVINDAPVKTLPQGPKYLVFGGGVLAERETIDSPIPQEFSFPYPPFLSFYAYNINIDWSWILPVRSAVDRVLLEDSRGEPLILIHEEPGKEILQVGFPLDHTDFALRYGFIVLLEGAVKWASEITSQWTPVPVCRDVPPGTCRGEGCVPSVRESEITPVVASVPPPGVAPASDNTLFTILLITGGILGFWVLVKEARS